MKRLFSVILILVLLVSCCTLTACGGDGDGGDGEVADNTKYYDSITSTLKLTKSYSGKSFLTDGIGSATLVANTDGDTTRFRLSQGDELSVRYYQIDTPESTGNVEKWGKSASLFVKQRLAEATEIVLEATGSRAVKDSYGTRYLGYVWYKVGEGDFKLLNLEIVENGFSDNKGMMTADYPYNEYFAKANNFARKNQLRLYSELDDPLYSTDPEDVTLKEFFANPDAYYNIETDAGSKIRFTACLISLSKTQTGTHTFVAECYDGNTRYTINVYAGYTSNSATTMKLGHLYRIVGTVQYYGGEYQVSGINYDVIFGADLLDYTSPTQRDYYLTFDSNRSYMSQYSDTLYTDITVVSTALEGTTLTIVGTTAQRTKDGVKSEVNTFTFTVTVASNYINNIEAGDVFSVEGYQYVEASGIITVLKYSDIDFK